MSLSPNNIYNDAAIVKIIDDIFTASNFTTTTSTITKAGWCLRDGLIHIATVDNNRMLPLIQQHGIPPDYDCCKQSNLCRHAATQDIKDPTNSFQSLCRIVAGQLLSGKAAQSIWKRLLHTCHSDLTPECVVELQKQDDNWYKNAGLSRTKGNSIYELAIKFINGTFTEEFFKNNEDDVIRKALLNVKGIGPWSCDMYIQFYLEHPNILPLGDLGVRKGLYKYFNIKDNTKTIETCANERLQIYEPYRSLVTYYMWRVADTPVLNTNNNIIKQQEKNGKDQQQQMSSPTKKRKRTITKAVTP